MSKQAKKVLIVEDDEAMMLGLDENLKFEGYDVIAASDGEEGLKLAIEKRPDLIILDVVLPGMTGYQVWRSLCCDAPQRRRHENHARLPHVDGDAGIRRTRAPRLCGFGGPDTQQPPGDLCRRALGVQHRL